VRLDTGFERYFASSSEAKEAEVVSEFRDAVMRGLNGALRPIPEKKTAPVRNPAPGKKR